MDETTSDLIELYIGTFNRVPDSAGLQYWITAITDNNWTIQNVAKSFFDQTETKNKYPDTLTDSEFVDEVYMNVLNRIADDEGKTYWLNELTTKSVAKHDFVIAIINGAKVGTSADDIALLNNKKEIGSYFASTLNLDDTVLAKRILEDITKESETVTIVKNDLDTFSNIFKGDYNLISAEDIDNTINATTGNDWIYSKSGNDTIYAGSGINWIRSADGIDKIFGDAGVDTIYGGGGDDTIYGGGSDDLLYGDADNDSIHGDAGVDTIEGGTGDDYIYGDDGADILRGNDGNDIMYGGADKDVMYGGNGDDWIDGQGAESWIDGGDGNDTIYGADSTDTIYGGSGNDIIYGLEGIDTLDGMTGDDTIYGGTDDDIINGNEGSDSLYGNSGNDILVGEIGSDYLYGEAGSDTLSGGESSDIFVFSKGDSLIAAIDTIKDFDFYGEDKDLLRLINQGTETINPTKIDTSTATTLTMAADLASTNDGATNAIVSWFQYLDNTYILEDLSTALTYVDGTDLIIKMQGLIDLTSIDSNTILFA